MPDFSSDFEIRLLLLRAIDQATRLGVNYADVRAVRTRTQHLLVKNGVVETIQSGETAGVGLRVLIGNGWGFASSYLLTLAEVERIAGLALETAHTSHRSDLPPIDLGPAITSTGEYVTPLAIDPFEVALEDKLALLLRADAELAQSGRLRTRSGQINLQQEERWFANSEGAFTHQIITETGGGIQAVAVDENEVQSRSYPNSFGRQQVSGGWENVLAWDLPGNAARVGSEALALLQAAPCPAGLTTTLILGGAQMALQIHESCGHATELDRVFGAEAAYAGTSFLTPEKLGHFRYGSALVNLTADSLHPLGLGTFGWDDEGIPAGRTALVRNGVFSGYLMSRETAARLGQVSNGCMRASGWNRIPLVRMTNISLEPGEWELEDLIADTRSGIYMETNRSWSIDDRRYNFQFGTELAYEIRHGKRTRLLRNATYTGTTPEFWNACDAICNQNHWQMWGTPNCGKGQPSQTAHTGHGAAPARFRKVRVGV